MIDVDGYRLSCYCKSHNGFITQRGQEYKMKAASVFRGLTGVPRAIRLVDQVSVSAPTETEVLASKTEKPLSSAEVLSVEEVPNG